MRDYFKIKTWFITILMFVVAFALSLAIVYYEFGLKQNIKISRASADNNASGWAWGSNVGWVSFNCTDTPRSCDNNGRPCPNGDECTSGGNCINTCDALSNYGVSIDITTGNFSGYAWSPNVGWVSFNEPDAPDYVPAPDYTFNTSCTIPGSCTAANNCTACYRRADNKIYGWAKILSMEDNGWIKLSGNKQDGQPWAPGLILDPTVNIFSGWAWNANEAGLDKTGIGWLSFNCSDVPMSCSGGTNPGTPCPLGSECSGGGSCVDTCTALSNYKVIGNVNRPPNNSTDLTAPDLDYVRARQDGALSVKLGWTFSDPDIYFGQAQYAYQIIIDKDNDPATPIFDSGKCLDVNSCEPVGSCDPSKCRVGNGLSGTTYFTVAGAVDGLEYDTAYHWWVKVWDDNISGNPPVVISASSALTQFDTNILGHVLTADNQAMNAAKNSIDPNLTFTTYKHEMPKTDFTHFPEEPSQGEEVQYTNLSKYSDISAPSTSIDCTNDRCLYEWTVTPGAAFKDTGTVTTATTSPILVFNAIGTYTVALKVTDSEGYYITLEDQVIINLELPKWREVKPE